MHMAENTIDLKKNKNFRANFHTNATNVLCQSGVLSSNKN